MYNLNPHERFFFKWYSILRRKKVDYNKLTDNDIAFIYFVIFFSVIIASGPEHNK